MSNDESLQNGKAIPPVAIIQSVLIENIDHISEKEISINYDEGLIIIKGEDLVLLKMLDDELLISGKIKNIELR